MKPENQFLFLACRQRMTPEAIDQLTSIALQNAIKWDQLFDNSDLNGVLGILYNNISLCPEVLSLIPESIKKDIKLKILRQILIKKECSKQLAFALDFFRKREIRVILLKGAALDFLVYDSPSFTSSKDIDIILDKNRESLSREDIIEIGNALDGKGIEYDFFSHHDMNMNGIFPIDFTAVWQEAKPILYQGKEAFVLSDEDMLLSVCINSCRKRFAHLKSFLDIREIIVSHPEIDWDHFINKCCKYQCEALVFTALTIAHKTLGCDVPDKVYRKLKPGIIRASAIHMITSNLADSRRFSKSKSIFTLFNRSIDGSLFLTYLSYRPNQIFSKFDRIVLHPPHLML
jgi:hypothetical protein